MTNGEVMRDKHMPVEYTDCRLIQNKGDSIIEFIWRGEDDNTEIVLYTSNVYKDYEMTYMSAFQSFMSWLRSEANKMPNDKDGYWYKHIHSCNEDPNYYVGLHLTYDQSSFVEINGHKYRAKLMSTDGEMGIFRIFENHVQIATYRDPVWNSPEHVAKMWYYTEGYKNDKR